MPTIFLHKKFQAGIAASFLIFIGQLFPAMASAAGVIEALAVINWVETFAPLMTAIAAQGVADFGKERAKAEINGKESNNG